MVDWVGGFFVPIIKLTFIGGISLYIVYIVGKAFHNVWEKSIKFVWKYKIYPTKPYPESTVQWIMNCMEAGIGWYDAKKLMLIKGNAEDQINETLWIYDQMIKEVKGGIDKHGRKFKRSYREVESKTEFPSI